MGLKERRAREREQRKQLIISAARRLLLEKGLSGTSMNQIAKRAELAIGTVYFYFNSKEALFASLQQEGLELLFKQIQHDCKREEDPAAKLRRTAAVYRRFSLDQKDYFDIINYFLSAPEVMLGAELKQEVDRHGDRILSFIADVVRSGTEQGRFVCRHPYRFAVMFWGACHGLVQFRKFDSTMLKGRSEKDVYRYAVDRMITGLANEH
jgi:AcrR family transcriptional regulator